MIVVKIEAGFADADDARLLRPRADLLEQRFVEQPGVVGMNADHGVTIRLLRCDLERAPVGLDRAAGGGDNHPAHARGAGALENRRAIGVVLRLADVAVRIDERDHFRGSIRGKSATGGLTRWPSAKPSPHGRAGPPGASSMSRMCAAVSGR